MYNLEDYSEKELRIIAGVIGLEIESMNKLLEAAKKYLPEGMVYNDVTRRDAEKLAILREHQVHLLSALAMVKDKNLIASN